MAFPVKVYKKHPDQGGRVVRVISTKKLDERSDMALRLNTGDYSSTYIPEEKKCPECGVWFWKESRSQEYCSRSIPPYCSRKAYERNQKKNGRKFRAKAKKRKAG